LYKPLRNALCFTDSYDKEIVITQINEKINFLCSMGFKFNKMCEIKCTEKTWYLKYENIDNVDNVDYDIIDKLCSDNSLSYLSINSIIYKNNYMIEIIDDKQIMYNPLSFRQNDISIKNKIYEILKSNVLIKNLYFIGGEMVFYTYLLNPINSIMYTDFVSIYEDAKYNFSENKEIYLINYDKDTLKKPIDDTYCLIANTSKHGLGHNLCKQILHIECNSIIIISCNIKSFLRDYKILINKYIIEQIYEIKTNYVVCVYFLKKIN
jgi:hypothetical protein